MRVLEPFILLYLTFLVHAVYDQDNPPQVENFDPAEANPQARLKCADIAPEQRLPVFGDFNPGVRTMQQLCVKPQFGGGPIGQHAGGFCIVPTGSPFEVIKIAFDTTAAAQTHPQLSNPRFQFECMQKCWCTYSRLHPNIPILQQPDPPALYPQMFFSDVDHPATAPPDQTYRITLDIHDDYAVPQANHQGRPNDQQGNPVAPVRYINILSKVSQIQTAIRAKQDRDALHALPDQAPAWVQPVSETTKVSLDPENRITCQGGVPNWSLGAPFGIPTQQHFPTLQSLCAVALDGGRRDANAGMYCHRSQYHRREAFWSEEQTPWLKWTWNGGPLGIVGPLRMHCWQNCWCDPEEKRAKRLTPVWDLLDSKLFRFGIWKKGSQSQWEARNQAHKRKGGFLGPPKKAGFLGGYLSQNWDALNIGALPKEPPAAIYDDWDINTEDLQSCINPDYSGGSPSVKLKQCHSKTDCAGLHGSPPNCFCRFPDRKTAKRLGIDPVFPPSICTTKMAKKKRDVGEGEMDEEEFWNGTAPAVEWV